MRNLFQININYHNKMFIIQLNLEIQYKFQYFSPSKNLKQQKDNNHYTNIIKSSQMSVSTTSISSIISIFTLINIIMLVSFVSPNCFFPNQQNGKCTKCLQNFKYTKGWCYKSLIQCLKFDNNNKCIQCLPGFFWNGVFCYEEFVSPVDKVDVLKQEDIRDQFVEVFGSYSKKVHQYFGDKYSQLKKLLPKLSQQLQTKKGRYIYLEYQIPQASSINKYKVYVLAFLDPFDKVSQLSYTSTPSSRTDIIHTHKILKQFLKDQLTDHILYTVIPTNNTFIFNFLHTKNYTTTRIFFSPQYLSSSNIAQKIQIKKIKFEQLAKQELIKMYPIYQYMAVTQIRKIGEYYIFYFGMNNSVSVRFVDYDFRWNKPYQFVDVMGVYGNQVSYTSNQVLIAVQEIGKEFPEIVDSQITNVQSMSFQGGMILKISTKKTIPPVSKPTATSSPSSSSPSQPTTVTYQFKVYILNSPSSSSPSPILKQSKKNSNIIYSENYNYNIDGAFLTNYDTVIKQTKIKDILPIDTVLFKYKDKDTKAGTGTGTDSRRYYKVIYDIREYLEFQYFGDNGKVNILGYFVDGENILETSLKYLIQQIRKQKNATLLKFLQQKQSPSQPYFLKQVLTSQSPSSTNYTLTLLNSSGTFLSTIQQKNKTLSLQNISKISNDTCYTLSSYQVITNQYMADIDVYLRENYPLGGYSLHAVQIWVGGNVRAYRVLYADQKLRQVEVMMEEKDRVFTVKKASYLNFGLESVNLDPSLTSYQNSVDYIKSMNLQGTQTPFFLQQNSTTTKSYYTDTKSIFQLYTGKKNNQKSTQVIYTRPYLLLPDNFTFANLIIPGNSSQNNNIQKIHEEVLNKYRVIVKESKIVFADKNKEGFYQLMYKGSCGYIKVEANVNNNTVNVGRLSITGYKEADFSNCQKYSLEGKCLSCNFNIETEFQGACFLKLQGCLIQAGPVCIKCNPDYIKSSHKCYKGCSVLFK